MRLAIVGTGVAGLVSAYLLHRRHDVTVFEAADYPGGHINTVDVQVGGRDFAVDTGFIVFNDTTYPGFCRLLDRLDVESAPTSMSFSVRSDPDRIEYGSRNLFSVFAQLRNLIRPRFHRVLRDVKRFHSDAARLAQMPGEKLTLGEFAASRGYSRDFLDYHLVPIGASIWSATPERILDFPAYHFVRFLGNHGLLKLHDHLQWRYVCGGSRTYVEALTRDFREKIRLNSRVLAVQRADERVHVTSADAGAEEFDRVIHQRMPVTKLLRGCSTRVLVVA